MPTTYMPPVRMPSYFQQQPSNRSAPFGSYYPQVEMSSNEVQKISSTTQFNDSDGDLRKKTFSVEDILK